MHGIVLKISNIVHILRYRISIVLDLNFLYHLTLASAYISGKTQVHVLLLIYTTSRHSGTLKNCPNPKKNCSIVFIVWVMDFDCEF